jgi:hypothetical protein
MISSQALLRQIKGQLLSYRRARIRTAMPEVGQLLVDALLLHLHLEDLQRLLQVLLLVHQLVEPSVHK